MDITKALSVIKGGTLVRVTMTGSVSLVLVGHFYSLDDNKFSVCRGTVPGEDSWNMVVHISTVDYVTFGFSYPSIVLKVSHDQGA
jgi:hypothetical protein